MDIFSQELFTSIKSRCIGCQYNHPSQLKHLYCFGHWEEDAELLLKEVLENLKHRGIIITNEQGWEYLNIHLHA